LSGAAMNEAESGLAAGAQANALTPASEIQARLGKLRDALRRDSIDAALIIQKADFFYFTGTAQQGWLYVPSEGKAILMVFKDPDRARAESPLPVISVASVTKITEVIAAHGLAAPGVLGLEMDVLPAGQYLRLAEIFPKARLMDVSLTIRLIRAVKSAYEIAIIRQCARFSDQTAALAATHIREGMTEIELAAFLENHARNFGHQGIVRMRLFGSEMIAGHVLSGPEGTRQSYLSSAIGGNGISVAIGQGPSFKPLRRHEPIVIDFVFAWQGYASDHTRIFSLGPLPDEMLRIQEAMLALQEETRRLAVVGAVCGEIYRQIIERVRQWGYSQHFMGFGERQVRFIGHGIGLELDEYPFIAFGQKLPLQEGMVMAIEPKMVIPTFGVLGIENTHLLTAAGLERLTNFPDAVAVLP
jgi:Xaa-Pro aminopeptidase